MAESHLANRSSVILIENLHTHKDSWKLARRIFRMLTSVGVIKNDIFSIEVEDRKGKARVYLRNDTVQHFVIKVFSDVRDVMSFYDVRKITAFPMGLRLSKSKGNTGGGSGQISMSAHDQNIIIMEPNSSEPVTPDVEEKRYITPTMQAVQPKDKLKGNVQSKGNPNGETSSSVGSETVHPDFEYLAEEEESTSTFSQNKGPNNSMLDASTSISGLPPESKSSAEDANETPTGKAIMVDVKTSTPQVSPCFCPETIFYHKNQHVGTETRHTEFKQGGVVFELRSFKYLLGRYLCAFLNTEGGVIYFGVTDDGRAIGIDIDQKFEDQIRLAIDTAVSNIIPTVPTSAYSINFAKIMDANGQILQGLKVLEVCVHPRYSTKTPFSFENNVYVRRDGSLRTV